MAFVEFKDVTKYYQMGEVRIAAADGVTFSIEKGEFVIIVGPSGAGKTTVLNMLGGMDTCSGGSIELDGALISGYNSRQLTAYRRYDVGFVFQFYNLVQNLTALENVELASEICREPLPAEEVLREVGLTERMNNFPAQLSGGEQQRVAIARALAKNPKLLLCDEPTLIIKRARTSSSFCRTPAATPDAPWWSLRITRRFPPLQTGSSASTAARWSICAATRARRPRRPLNGSRTAADCRNEGLHGLRRWGSL